RSTRHWRKGRSGYGRASEKVRAPTGDGASAAERGEARVGDEDAEVGVRLQPREVAEARVAGPLQVREGRVTLAARGQDLRHPEAVRRRGEAGRVHPARLPPQR